MSFKGAFTRCELYRTGRMSDARKLIGPGRWAVIEAADLFIGAGDRDRTGDIQLGKLTFYH